MARRKLAALAPGGSRMASPAKACLKIASSVSCGDNPADSILAFGIPAIFSGMSQRFTRNAGRQPNRRGVFIFLLLRTP
jgi:hypothetical protein